MKHRFAAIRADSRPGFTLTELVVATGLLMTAIATITPITLQGSRLLQDARRQHLAMEELSNQIDRLSALDSAQRTAAINDLTPSPALTRALPSPLLSAEVIRDESGTRLLVQLDWDRTGDPPPLSLVGWLPQTAEDEP